MTFRVPNLYRIRSGPMGSDDSIGDCEAFDLSIRMGQKTHVIASSDGGWEHVSVSHPKSTPTWETMCLVKSLFWDEEDCVMQLHPPKSDYVNKHPHCLHLWAPVAASGVLIPRPPKWMVG